MSSRTLPRLCAAGIVAVLALAAIAPAAPRAADPPATPSGLTAIALDGEVGLAWQAAAGATSYELYRASAEAPTPQRITPEGFGGTRFVDTTAANGETYYYGVRAGSPDAWSAPSNLAQARPRARSCSDGNAVVVENCFPGTAAWKTTDPSSASNGGIVGFASASSIDAGDSVDLRIEAEPDVPYHVEIYRTGHYGGDQGRLVGTIPGLTALYQPPCHRELAGTGVVDCSDWSVSATVTTTAAWPSGVYLLKLVRDDNGEHNEVLLVVRDDGSDSDVLYQVPTTTYQAYNSFLGKALYDGISDAPDTIAGSPRAVEVSFDRPYTQPGHEFRNDWYTHTDVAAVTWLERQGYDVTYIANEDLHADGAQAQRHRVLISGVHDEYWSQEMVDAALAARDAGTSLVFLGANAAYWQIRFAASPVSGRAGRTVVSYKTIQGGPADPGGPTSTWRDPAGANAPENGLIGQMYAGDNSGRNFPLRVSAAEGRHRIWRHTPLAELEPGTTASVGTGIVGWEWDSRVENGFEPPGVTTVASSPVSGGLIRDNGRFQVEGTTLATSTLYRTPGGASVFATGTNNWARGLARNVRGEGEPDQRIQQATANVLADMGAAPATPAGVELDVPGAPAVTATSPPAGASGVPPNAALDVTLDRELDPATIDGADLTLTDPAGAQVEGSVEYAASTRTLTLESRDTLEPFTVYTARLGTGIETWLGEAPGAPLTWTFSTGTGTPPVVTSRTPAADGAGVPTDTAVSARLDRRLDPATVSSGTFTLRPAAGGGAVGAQVSYDPSTRTARLVPDQRLAESTRYTAELATAIRATDGMALTAPDAWSFTTGPNLAVTGRTPAPLAGGVSPAAVVRAGLSRAADPATITAGSFQLRDPAGQVVAATVGYDPASRTATLQPAQPLTLLSTYTATIGGSVHAADGAPLDGATWSFTTAATPPPGPGVSSTTPAAEAPGVSNETRVHATFDLALDPNTVTGQTFRLRPAGGAPVAAAVSYDGAAHRATLTPTAPLEIGTRYTAELTTAIRTTTGAPLAATVAWSFTTAECPCSLMGSTTPTWRGLPVRDNRPGPGPWSYELATRISVQEPSELVAVRFFKEAGETGTHVGRLWNATGTELAQATFEHETASGWQRQALAEPVTLLPGQVYTVSVGVHDFYAKTVGGLREQIVSGPLRTVADGMNGSFASVAGRFPTEAWASSNYFVDAVVRLGGRPPRTPAVASVGPLAGATGTGLGERVTATFSLPLDGSTVHAGSFTLHDAAGAAVEAQVTYDADTATATLEPAAPLEPSTSYTARLGTAIRSDDETPLAAPFSWTFATRPPDPPVVEAISPVAGAADISGATAVTATFSQPMDPATLGASLRLLGPGGGPVAATVSYDDATRTATLRPGAPLSPATTYTAQVTTGARSALGVALEQPEGWTFSTSSCPCRLYGAGAPGPELTGLSTRNGRDPAGTWSLELGIKVRVGQPARLEAIRFHKDADETGAHVGRLWTAGGTLLASTAFTGETASGWQQQALGTPVELLPGQTYVVSVGVNRAFGQTRYALESPLAAGPLRSVADDRNGVFADAAGAFPTQSYASSSYHVDAVVR